MLPLLVPHFGEGWSIFLCPLFFGVGKYIGAVSVENLSIGFPTRPTQAELYSHIRWLVLKFRK